MRSRLNVIPLLGILICLAAPTTAAENNAPNSEIAEKQLEIALQRQAKLEKAGVRIWGVERLVTSFAEATRKLVDGDAHFRA